MGTKEKLGSGFEINHNEEKKSNATRFVFAYNTIDQTLRARHNIRRSLSFAEMIRKTVVMDYIVRKYEDELIDYGRLRNAIIHKSSDDFLIAEPHDDVVDQFEKIAELIAAPPKVFNTVCTKDVFTVEHTTSLLNVMKIMFSSTFSNIPVYKNGGVIGVANGQKILDYLGKIVTEMPEQDMDDFLRDTTIETFVKETSDDNNKCFEVCDIDLTVEKALNLFFQNRKLLMIILTQNGMLEEAPLGLITPTDIMDLNKFID